MLESSKLVCCADLPSCAAKEEHAGEWDCHSLSGNSKTYVPFSRDEESGRSRDDRLGRTSKS